MVVAQGYRLIEIIDQNNLLDLIFYQDDNHLRMEELFFDMEDSKKDRKYWNHIHLPTTPPI